MTEFGYRTALFSLNCFPMDSEVTGTQLSFFLQNGQKLIFPTFISVTCVPFAINIFKYLFYWINEFEDHKLEKYL